jgi:hypothetical protein
MAHAILQSTPACIDAELSTDNASRPLELAVKTATVQLIEWSSESLGSRRWVRTAW